MWRNIFQTNAWDKAPQNNYVTINSFRWVYHQLLVKTIKSYFKHKWNWKTMFLFPALRIDWNQVFGWFGFDKLAMPNYFDLFVVTEISCLLGLIFMEMKIHFLIHLIPDLFFVVLFYLLHTHTHAGVNS